METQGELTLESPVSETSQGRRFDTGVVGGFAIGTVLLIVSVLLTGEISKFIDPLGFIVVVGGTLASTMVQFSIPEVLQAWQALKSVMYARNDGALERILYFVELARRSRREGMLVLDDEAGRSGDLFLAKALEMTVDGTDSETIRRVMENELRVSLEQQGRGIAVFQTMATYAPAFGLIGTLIGLVSLLGALNSPESVGPAMSVALMTTLYGALLANLICLPIAGKLRTRSEEEALIKTISIEGALALARGDNPIVVEQRLQSFLPSA